MEESNLAPPRAYREREGTASAAAVAAADAEGGERNPTEPVMRRELSFSRWCGENGILRERPPADDDGRSGEAVAVDIPDESELPLFQGGRSKLGQDGFKYSPVDIEISTNPGDSLSKLQTIGVSGNSPISAGIVLRTLLFILIWYTFSTCLTVYNKTLLGDHMGKFPAPLLMNTVHFLIQAILSNIIVYIQSRIYGISRIKITWKDYFVRVIPTALGTALDVNLSNESLVFISVTFATMCKSAAPIFLLMFAFAFRLEKPSFKLLGIIFVMSFGILLTVARETEFEFWGFLFIMLAAVMSGFRWCMTQILLQKEEYGLKNPIALMSYVTPVMALITFVLSLILDPWHDFKANVYFDNSQHLIRSCQLLLLGGSLAFFMVIAEYILVSVTSAVTVTVAGIVKEAVTILVAVFYFHDQFTWLKGIGLVTIMVGVTLFNWYKYEKLKTGHLAETEEGSRTAQEAAKYVILDDLELQDDAS